jgi:hypothetical protein
MSHTKRASHLEPRLERRRLHRVRRCLHGIELEACDACQAALAWKGTHSASALEVLEAAEREGGTIDA